MAIGKPNDGEARGGAAEAPRGRGRPQVRSDEDTRAIIFEAARAEFAQSGYAATGMESVARRAGVSTAFAPLKYCPVNDRSASRISR